MRKVVLSMVSALTATVSVALPMTSAAAAPLDANLARGSAYGAQGTLIGPNLPPLPPLPNIEIGPVASVSVPCISVSGHTYSNHVAKVEVPSDGLVIKTGAVTNDATPTSTATSLDSTVHSTVHDVNLLGGVIKATEVAATSRTTQDGTGVNKHTPIDDYAADNAGSGATFVGLTIGGVPLPLTPPAPNTKIDLPGGVGRVVLNEQLVIKSPKIKVGSVDYTSGLTVNALHVYVDDLAGYHGSFVVGHAVSRLRPSTGLLSGYAFASQVNVSPGVSSGRQSVIYEPCLGTNGVLKEILGVGLFLPGVVTLGATRGTVQGLVPAVPTAANPIYSESTETIKSLKLLGESGLPLISADVMKSTTRSEAVSKVASTGTVEVVNLRLPGMDPFSGAIPKNTKIDIPGLGFVTLNEQVCLGKGASSGNCTFASEGQLTVRAVHLKVTVPDNPLGLAVGAEVWLGAVHSKVRL